MCNSKKERRLTRMKKPVGKLLKGKRGFSLVEVVVALAVIVTVSVAAMSFIKTSSIASDRELAYSEARLYASNALEIFKYAKDEAQYTKLVEDKLTKPESGYVSVDIVVKTENSESTFTATATKQNGDTLFKLTYTK